MNKNVALAILTAALLTACAGAQSTRTSQNTMIIDAGAAPICGSVGAAKVASQSAAIETIRAGYDRYIISGGTSANNVNVVQMPGRYNTYGTATNSGNFGTFNATTTYQPGPTLVAGSHDRSLSLVMFKPGDTGYENGIDAREALGPEWQKIVNSGVMNCL